MENFEPTLSLTNSLDSFKFPDVQSSIENSSYVDVYPSTVITKNNPIVFEYMIPNGEWVDLGNIWVKTKLKITKSDETDLPDDAQISTISYPALTCFKALKFFINGKLVEQINDMHILSYLYCLLGSSSEAQQTILASGGFYPLDENYTTHTGNAFEKLKPKFEKSTPASFMARIASGVFDAKHYIPSGCKLRIELFPTEKAKFLINLSDLTDVTYEIISANLEIRELTLTPNLNDALLEKFDSTSIKIPCNRVIMRNIYVNKGSQAINNNVICRAIQPSRVFAVILSSENYFGNEKLNTLGFNNWNVETCGLQIGNRTVPTNARNTKANFENHEYLDLYHRLYRCVNGNSQSSAMNHITYDKFDDIMSVFSFDNSGTGAHEMQPIKEGTTSLFMTFSKPLYTAAVVVLAIEYQCVLTLTSSGFVSFDPAEI
jgi:hypothetical protein